MNLATVMGSLATALDTINGLRIYGYVPDAIQVPAAIVAWPEDLEFDVTGARGMDRYTVPVMVVVSDVTARTAPALLSPYVAGSGAKSIKAVLEAATPNGYDSLRVMSARVEPITFGATDYVTATFAVDVVGPGT